MCVGLQCTDFVSFKSAMFFSNFSCLTSDDASAATRGTSSGGIGITKPGAYVPPVDGGG